MTISQVCLEQEKRKCGMLSVLKIENNVHTDIHMIDCKFYYFKLNSLSLNPVNKTADH